MFSLIILYATLASTFAIGKAILDFISPVLLVGTRMIIAGSLMLGYQYLRNRKALRIARADWWQLLQVAFIGIYFSFIPEFWGMLYMPSFKACTIFALGPFITYVVECVKLRQPMQLHKWLGILIGFVGILPIIIGGSGSENVLESLLVFSWPEVALIVAAICYSYAWFPMQELVKKNYSTWSINGYAMLLGGLAALATAPLLEQVFITSYLHFAWLLALLMLTGNVICYNLYAYLLKKYSATLISFASILSPLFGALFGWLFLHEQITWHFFASMGVVAIAFVVFFYDELKAPGKS